VLIETGLEKTAVQDIILYGGLFLSFPEQMTIPPDL